MSKERPRSPSEIAQDRGEKRTYSFSIREGVMNELKDIAELEKSDKAQKVVMSNVVEEALVWYIKTVRDTPKRR